jgi:hypothetical protein
MYLKQNEKDIYIAPMLTVAEHIADWQSRNKQNNASQQYTPNDQLTLIQPLEVASLRNGPYQNDYATYYPESLESIYKEKGLKDYYKKYFTMGVAVSPVH